MGNAGESFSTYGGIVFLRFGDRWDVGHFFSLFLAYISKKYIAHGRQGWLSFVLIIRPVTIVVQFSQTLHIMVAYFCHHLSDNYVDLSDIYVDLSDLYVDLSLIPSVEK